MRKELKIIGSRDRHVFTAIVISGFLALVSKNPICFSDGSMSIELILKHKLYRK